MMIKQDSFFNTHTPTQNFMKLSGLVVTITGAGVSTLINNVYNISNLMLYREELVASLRCFYVAIINAISHCATTTRLG